MRIVNRFIFANRKFYLGASLFLLILFGGSMATVSAAGDCDNNAIIRCGFSSKSDFINTVKSGNSGNGHNDLKAIYTHYGLAPADYTRFVTSARAGLAYRDGRIVVDGKVVATNARSVGRIEGYQGSHPFSTPIAGAGTLYGNTDDQAFAPGVNSISAEVMFNAQGQVEFAVLTGCGNPVYGTNVTPSYSCDLLHESPVTGQARTFKFTTDARAGNNASIAKLVYTFGDGKSQTVSSPGTAVTHTYPKDGNYTARVTVYVSLPGNQTITVTSANCAKLIVVATPFYQCIQLTDVTVGSSKYQYKFTVTGKAGNGATLTTADFTFGDGGTVKGVPVVGGVTASTTHPYAKYGNQKATATFHVKLPGGKTATITSAGCAKTVPVAVPYLSCVQLGGAILDASKNSYSFTASASFGNGATFKSADFDFGDKQSTKNVIPSGTSVTTAHAYATAGTYTATTTMYFIVNGNTKDVKSVKCTAHVTPTQPPTPECKPGVPQGSALCSPCQYNSSIPSSDTEHCVAPVTTLPNTGAGDVIAIFGAAAVGGFLIFRQFIYKKGTMDDSGTMTAEGLFVGPVVSPDTGVVVSHHVKPKHARQHPNSVHPLHHPTYHHPHRFRPESHESDEE